ncbi:unnamed protein product [Bemisia tabaci]|uniref:Uncharacterized protein n=2 Tax=Bemisia tabaci TaxID=7038 RepID=A0A9P0A173_BEMTA|nr:unnamed protein product [Bemisia tabaci]
MVDIKLKNLVWVRVPAYICKMDHYMNNGNVSHDEFMKQLEEDTELLDLLLKETLRMREAAERQEMNFMTDTTTSTGAIEELRKEIEEIQARIVIIDARVEEFKRNSVEKTIPQNQIEELGNSEEILVETEPQNQIEELGNSAQILLETIYQNQIKELEKESVDTPANTKKL